MAGTVAPNIITDGLVLYLDTANVKSFKGEPTTNLISNPILGDYGNSPGSTNNTISPDGSNNATIPIPDANADRYQKVIAGGGHPSGTQFTYSWHYKQLGPHLGTSPNEPGGLLITGLVNCTLVGTATMLYDLNDGWSRWKATFQIVDGSLESIFRLYFGFVIGINGNSAAYYGHQFEQKAYATPFVMGTRGTTVATGGGWGDISGNNNHGELVNGPTYSSDNGGSIVFDGVDDIINTDIFSGRNPSTDPFTVEAFLKSDTVSGTRMWIDASANGTNQRFYSSLDDGGGNPLGIQASAWNDSTPISTAYIHQTIVMDGNTARSYRNGVATYTKAYTSYTLPGSLKIGGRAGFPWLGRIPIIRIYNRALTPEEIQQNYNATKSRFGI
jgi:hypothetical protein